MRRDSGTEPIYLAAGPTWPETWPRDRWIVAYNNTRKTWDVIRSDSPAICACWVQADAETIARLLNAEASA